MVMMTNPMIHVGLWLLAGLCLLLAIATVVGVWLLPVTVSGQLDRLKLPHVQPNPSSAQKQMLFQGPSLASYEPIWKLQLRPVVQRQAPAPSLPKQTSSAVPGQPFTAKLTGTILEPDHSMALFTTRSGEIQFVSIGQMIENAKVIQIQPQQVILQYKGQTLTLQVIEVKTSSRARSISGRPRNVNSRRPLR